MAPLVYMLCAISSLCCASLLVRRFLYTRSRFLLQSSICFIGLAIANALLFVDLVLLPGMDLLVYRQLVTFVSLTVMAWAFVWETR